MIIYKYPIKIQDVNVIPMQKGAKVLHVDMQNGQACIWVAIPNLHAEQVHHVIGLLGTGQSSTEMLLDRYVGTFQMPPFVWHVFDCGEVGLGKGGGR